MSNLSEAWNGLNPSDQVVSINKTEKGGESNQPKNTVYDKRIIHLRDGTVKKIGENAQVKPAQLEREGSLRDLNLPVKVDSGNEKSKEEVFINFGKMTAEQKRLFDGVTGTLTLEPRFILRHSDRPENLLASGGVSAFEPRHVFTADDPELPKIIFSDANLYYGNDLHPKMTEIGGTTFEPNPSSAKKDFHIKLELRSIGSSGKTYLNISKPNI